MNNTGLYQGSDLVFNEDKRQKCVMMEESSRTKSETCYRLSVNQAQPFTALDLQCRVSVSEHSSLPLSTRSPGTTKLLQ
ncbi:hypothetical protein PoB_002314700 [Plakobranchus ocellatus]|uniref:Uncharacterized protein n=1 Tax=Plakobranchus ocellatus TaxID=259542 RepID=A0AAV3ZPP1_9GAST|nr:hypothetical protein PoB_002314700 [Plakobranchus ocellatus]